MLIAFWERVGRKLSAGQTALPNSDPHSIVLHLNKTHRKHTFTYYHKHSGLFINHWPAVLFKTLTVLKRATYIEQT